MDRRLGWLTMYKIKSRFGSKVEYFQLFLVCAFPIHIWAIINFFNSMPSMLLKMNNVQLLGVAAYVFVFALFESLLVFGFLFLISVILPRRYLASRLVPIGSLVVILASISVALIHLYDVWELDSIEFNQWAALWVIFGLSALALTMIWMRRNQRVEAIIRSGAERLSLLSLVYVSVDVLGLLVILFRNSF